MTVVFDDMVRVHYGFLWLTAAEQGPPDGDAQGGQQNGLCGGAVPGALGMVTGLHTGPVPVRVEALDNAPPLGEEWEDIVEVSFFARDRACALTAFEEGHEVLLPQSGWWRARWSARGMDAACDSPGGDEPALDAYLLQLWPASPAPDVVLRETSVFAGHRHDAARKRLAPPSPEELALREAEQRAERERASVARKAQELLDSWGGTLPSPRVLALGYGRAQELSEHDRGLLDVLAGQDDEALRGLTAWVCRTACRRAGLEDLDWIAPALTALERGQPPAPTLRQPVQPLGAPERALGCGRRISGSDVRGLQGRGCGEDSIGSGGGCSRCCSVRQQRGAAASHDRRCGGGRQLLCGTAALVRRSQPVPGGQARVRGLPVSDRWPRVFRVGRGSR